MIRLLRVEITRFPSRNLCARVLQLEAGRKTVRGQNLLTGRRIRKIETAKSAVQIELGAKGIREIEFVVDAAPDTPTPYKHVDRRELARQVS